MPDPIDWRKLLSGGGEEEEEAGRTLRDLIGQTFAHTGAGFAGTLRVRSATTTERRQGHDFNGSIFYLDSGTSTQFLSGRSGFSLMDSLRNISIVSSTGAVTTGGKASETDLDRLFPGVAGGAAAVGRTQFPSEQALDIAQAQRMRAQTEIERAQLQADITATEQRLKEIAMQEAAADERQRRQLQAERAMLEVRLENDRRTIAFSAGMAERGTLIQQRAETGREMMRLGPDPFRQAAILSGGTVMGTTPQQAVVGQAQAFMNRPLPQVSMAMGVPQLEQSIAQMQAQGMTQPTFGGGFGLAGGGVIEMEQKDGAFSPKQSWLIGEGKHGEGLKMGTAEVLTVEKGPFGFKSVEVTPLAGAAQSGLELSTLQALQPLFGQFGPTFARPTSGVAGRMGEISVTDFGSLSRMGITPRYVREIETSKVYAIQNGVRRYVPTPEIAGELGMAPHQIINAYASEIARIAPTEGPYILSGQDPFSPSGFPGPATSTPAFQGFGMPLINPTTGAVLPAPFKRAGQLSQWQRERPDLFSLAMSAYGSALDPTTGLPTGGLSPDVIRAQIKSATPTGPTWNPQRIGFVGSRY